MNYPRLWLAVAFVAMTALAKADEPRQEVLEHEAMPRPGGEPALRLELSMSHTVWGDWERPRFDYRIVNATDQPIQFQDGDRGRGFAGKIIYLRDPQGKIRSFGSHWAEPKRYRPNFGGEPTTFDPGVNVWEQVHVEPASYFGPLSVGNYALQMVVPAGRMTVDGKPTLQLASAPVEFSVVPLSPALRRAMETIPKDSAGISLEPTARSFKLSKIDRDITFRFVNGSNATIRYSRYADSDLVPIEAEFFCGDGRWRIESRGVCGTGLETEKLEPMQVATIKTFAPSDSGRFVRFTIQVTDEGKLRSVVSPVVELVRNEN